MGFARELKDQFVLFDDASRGPHAFVQPAAPRASGAPLQVHLVAPPLVCWGLQRLVLAAGTAFQLAGTSARLQEAMPALERELPDVVVLDFDDGYAVEDLYDAYLASRAKILVLTSATEAAIHSSLMHAGASGVLTKREGPASLLRAMDLIGRGDAPASRPAARPSGGYPPVSARRVDAERDRVASLTQRERQTVSAVTSDASVPVKVIADRLCISEHTLRNHLTSIYSKLGVTGRLALHAYAEQHGLKGVLSRLAPHGR